MATVLIVEDDEQVRVFAESYLRRHGHRTVSAETAEEALAVLERVNVDLLFSDIALHGDGFAGIRLARQATRERPGIKVLYAGARELTDGVKSLLADRSAVLAKPYTVGQLRDVVTAQVAAGPHVD